MKTWFLGIIFVFLACTKAANTPLVTPPVTPDIVTGTWQASTDGGLLQYILLEDAGTLTGMKLISDPLVATQFHTLDVLTGTHTGTSVILHTTVTADTITATFDGGTLAGIDPFSEPVILRDGGPAYQLNIPFLMTRISTAAPLPDAGDVQ